jgi:hypothetical protein
LGWAGQGMAQTSTFEAGRIARTETLAATLERAADYAAGPMHGAVTLEHLLLALTEDDDAVGVLSASKVDLGRLRNEVAAFIGQQQYPALPQGMRPGPDAELTKILTYAEAASRQSGRTEINGAIVLAAIVGEGRSMAATFLKAQGLTFQAAIKVIQQVLAPEPPPPPPPPAAQESMAEPGDLPDEYVAGMDAPPHPAPVPEVPRTVDDEIARPTPEARREVSDNAMLAGTRSPPIQKPLWEPVGIPSIRRPDPPPRPAVQPRPAPPSPPAAEPAPAPPPASAPAVPAAKEAEVARPAHSEPPPRPQNPPASTESDATSPAPSPELRRDILAKVSNREHVEPARIPAQPPATTNRPPPLPQQPHREPSRRPADGPAHGQAPPPPPPPGGLGAARPPAPRPALRMPPNAGEGHQITAPWPEPNDLRAPTPPSRQTPPRPGYPPPPVPMARAPHPEHDPRAARSAPPPGSRGQAPPGRPATTEQGQLIENIPRRMKVGVIESFEVRIARDDVVDAGRGLAGRGAPHQHLLQITRAMSVRLQGEPGRFYIETSSPETQWTGSRNEHLTSDYAVWRFTVIPQRRGPADLTLIVSSRTIGSDGVVADTSLPEQRITIRVSANVTRGAKRWIGWLLVAILGGVVAKLGEGFWEQGLALVRQLLAI